MKSGMSKFTKGCLITALITFVLGCLICGVGALLGGFRALEGTNIRKLTGIPFYLKRYDDGTMHYGFGWDDDLYDVTEWDDDLYDDMDWDEVIDWSKYENWNKINKSGETVELNLTADTLRNLYIELGECELHVMEAKDDHVSVKVSGYAKNFRYVEEDGDSLRLVNKTEGRFVYGVFRKKNAWTKVTLYLPKNLSLNYAEIEIGAGMMASEGLQAHEMDLDVGAGECRMNGNVVVDCMDLNLDAGRITLEGLQADKLGMTVGAGELVIKDAVVGGETELDLGLGNAELSGLFTGDLDVICGLGNVTLNLNDAEQDHNYDIECEFGNVRLGNRSYTGLADKVRISNGSASTYEIECNMGNMNINFAQ